MLNQTQKKEGQNRQKTPTHLNTTLEKLTMLTIPRTLQ